MDINVHMTQQAAGTGKAIPGQPVAGKGNGVFAGGAGANFFDLIFARVTAEAAGKAAIAGNAQTTADQVATDEAAALSVEQILAAFAQVEPGSAESAALIDRIETALQSGEIKEYGPLSVEQILEMFKNGTPLTIDMPVAEGEKMTPAALKKKLAAAMEALIAGLPQDGDATPAETGEAIAETIIEGSKGKPVPVLIAANLTPQQMTDAAAEVADGTEQGMILIAGFINILPPQAKKDAVFLPRGIVVVQPQTGAETPAATPAAAPATSAATDDIASALNALTTGETAEGLPEDNSFENVLRVLEAAQGKGTKTGQQTGDNGIAGAIRQIEKHISAGLSTVPGARPQAAEVAASFAPETVFPDGLDFAALPGQSTTMTATAQLTSLASHAPQAVLPHPATQMVAATIAKATINGESKNITISLDPPDLGKVHVKMEIGKDKSIKAHMVIEKPETYLMLQRDAHVLERALQAAGLDAGSAGLSFELSQDGNMFGQDRDGAGGDAGGGARADADDAAVETIEVRMDWFVDPETGRMRYDALV